MKLSGIFRGMGVVVVLLSLSLAAACGGSDADDTGNDASVSSEGSSYDDLSDDDGTSSLTGYTATQEFADHARETGIDFSGTSDSDLGHLGVGLCEQLELTKSVDDTVQGVSELADLLGLALSPHDMARLIGIAVGTTCPDLSYVVKRV